MVEEQQYIVRVRLPRGKELLGIVESKLAGNKLKVRCSDKKYRICRIPGRIKKYVWIKDDDIILMQPWDIKGDQFADVVIKYTPSQANWLRNKGFLNF